MARRTAVTLLLLATDRTVRADLSDGPSFEPVSVRAFPAGLQDDPAVRTAAALSAGGRVGRAVWILWDRAWLQTVDLSAAAVEGLDALALSRSLAFEAEPLSAVPAADSALAAVPVPVLTVTLPSSANPSTSNSGSFAALSGSGIRNPSGAVSPSGILDPVSVAGPAAPVDPSTRRAFWLVQIAASVRDALEQVVNQSGGRLAGVLHPAGLPRADWSSPTPPAAANAQPWARVEVWDQLTVFLSRRGSASAEGAGDANPLSVRVISSRAGSANWRGELSALLAELPATSVGWMGRGSPPNLVTAEGSAIAWREQSLAGDAPPTDWLRAWAAELTEASAGRSAQVPLVAVPRRASELPKFVLVGVAALILIGGLCFSHAQGLADEAARLRSEAELIESSRRAAAAANRKRPTPVNTAAEEKKLKDEITGLQRTVTEATQTDRELAVRESRVMATVAAARDRQNQTRAARLGQREGVPALLALLAEIDARTAREPWRLVLLSARLLPNGESQLSGACQDRQAADQFATLLKRRLEPSGWTVADFEKEQTGTVVGQREYSYLFQLRLRPPALRVSSNSSSGAAPAEMNPPLVPVGDPPEPREAPLPKRPPPPPPPPQPLPQPPPPNSDANMGGRL